MYPLAIFVITRLIYVQCHLVKLTGEIPKNVGQTLRPRYQRPSESCFAEDPFVLMHRICTAEF